MGSVLKLRPSTLHDSSRSFHPLFGFPIHSDLLQVAPNDSNPQTWLPAHILQGEQIDFFLSHSWHDDANIKYDALEAFVRKFVARKGREPTFWLDKVCIDQSNIGDGLRVLPVNVMAAKKMLVMLALRNFTPQKTVSFMQNLTPNLTNVDLSEP